MNNFFICSPRISSAKKPLLIKAINKSLRLINARYRLEYEPDPTCDMTTQEQRINYFHLADSVVANKIQGDFVELGCFTGECAILFQKVIQMHNSDKMLHLFDSFETKFNVKGNVEDVLLENFKNVGLKLPVIHKGFFEDTVPCQLPERIAFAHIDCGFGGDPLTHKKVVIHCLEAIYPRMSKDAVCVLMDYHDKSINKKGFDANPGVKLACDEFFASKPEKVVTLYAKQGCHGFFRKVS